MYIITHGTWEAQEDKGGLLLEELKKYVRNLEFATLDEINAFVLGGKNPDSSHIFCTLMVLPDQRAATEPDCLEQLGYKDLQERCLKKGLIRVPVVDRKFESFSGFLYRQETVSPRSFAVVAELKYKDGRRPEGEPFWTDIANYAEGNEPGTYTYLWSRDKDFDNVLWSFERYESEKYLWKTHVEGSEAVQRSFRLQKDIRDGTTHGWFETRCCVVQKKYYAV